MSVKNMAGKSFGLIEVIERVENDKYGNAQWRCRCSCGKEFWANGSAIRSGHIRSCGHLQRKAASMLNRTHGMSKTRLYKAWAGMIQRCENPNNSAYRDYGAKGVAVCPEWHEYETFHAWAMTNGYRPGLTIERKQITLGYSPDNCCFVTRDAQNRNTSRTHRIPGDGVVFTAAEAARYVGMSRSAVAKWVREGKVKNMSDVVSLAKERRKE